MTVGWRAMVSGRSVTIDAKRIREARGWSERGVVDANDGNKDTRSIME